MFLLFQPLLSPASALHSYYLRLSSASSHLPRNHLYSCGPQTSRPLCPWDFPGKNTGAGCHFLLHGVFPTQGSNRCLLRLLHCRQILYHWASWEALRNHSPFLIHCLWFLRFWDKVHNYCSQKKKITVHQGKRENTQLQQSAATSASSTWWGSAYSSLWVSGQGPRGRGLGLTLGDKRKPEGRERRGWAPRQRVQRRKGVTGRGTLSEPQAAWRGWTRCAVRSKAGG